MRSTGVARYEGIPYLYRVSKERGGYRVTFDGRFGPSFMVREEKNIAPEAERVLNIFIREQLAVLDARLDHAFGFLRDAGRA